MSSSDILGAYNPPAYVRPPLSTDPTRPKAPPTPGVDGQHGPVGSSFQGGSGRDVAVGRKPTRADTHSENAYEDRRWPPPRQRDLHYPPPPPPISVPTNTNLYETALQPSRSAPYVVENGNVRELHNMHRPNELFQYMEEGGGTGGLPGDSPDSITVTMFRPEPYMPRALPASHIVYEKPPYLVSPFSGFEMAPQPLTLSPTPSPRMTRRALAPLHALNRLHPYKREIHDQRALELLRQSPVTARRSPDLGDTPSPGTMSATYRFGVDPYREGVITRDSFLASVEAAIARSPFPGGSSSIGSLRAQMIDVCSTKDLYKRVLSLEGSRAQKWLDALQMMLDREPLSPNPSETRRAFLKALLRLSGKAGLCPNTLQLSHQVHKDEEPVDEGSFGEVYQGRIANRMVAVKVFRVNQRTDMPKLMKTIWREAIIWCQLYHPNVLPCYGIHRPHNQSYRIGLVSPWMGSGNIAEYLRNNPLAGRSLLLSDIASGMSYLHENKIVHGDLKGPNILVSASGRACLADFGLSRLSDPSLLVWTSIRTATTKSTGTPRWQAPELLDPNDDANPKTTTASDVYSYGCVCYEVMTGNIPFYLTKNHYSIPMLVVAGNRPRKPDLTDPAYQQYGLTEPIWSFIEACWKQDPDSRPTAAELQESSIFSSLPDHRPTQDWGETSAAEFRRWAMPS